jgi:hypothetical protein
LVEAASFALAEEARPAAARELTGREEALLVATACSSPLAGCARWTLDLLAGEMVKPTEHEAVSRETAYRRLVEKELKPWQKKMWCIPKVDGTYVARMEDVPDLHEIRTAEIDATTANFTNRRARVTCESSACMAADFKVRNTCSMFHLWR